MRSEPNFSPYFSLKSSFATDDPLLNSGRVMSPMMERNLYQPMTVKLIVESTLSLEPFIFTCDSKYIGLHIYL